MIQDNKEIIKNNNRERWKIKQQKTFFFSSIVMTMTMMMINSLLFFLSLSLVFFCFWKSLDIFCFQLLINNIYIYMYICVCARIIMYIIIFLCIFNIFCGGWCFKEERREKKIIRNIKLALYRLHTQIF